MMILPLVLLLAAPATPAAPQPHWTKATTANFELLTTAGAGPARAALLEFEQLRSFFLKTTGWQPTGKGRARIIAFQSEKEYRPYRSGENAAAHAGGGRDYDEIVMRSIGPEDSPVAAHEYMHLLLKHYEKLPIWLNEGFAEVYSTFRPAAAKVEIGAVIPGRLAVLQRSKLVDLPILCAVERESPWYTAADKQPLFYAESWALVHMLFLGDDYRAKFPEFLSRISGGAPAADAVQQAFGKSLGDVSKDLERYIRAGRFRPATFEVAVERSAESPEIVPAQELEVGLALANILVDVHKDDEARQALLQLRAKYPSESAIPEALATLAWRSHDTDEIRAELARATELGTRNPVLYYDYSTMLEEQGAQKDKVIPLLRKAVELDPEFRSARLHLAHLLLSAEDWKAALEQLRLIRTPEPEEAFPYYRAMAYASYRLGRKDDARQYVARAAEFASNAAQRDVLRQLVDAVSDHPRGNLSAEDAARMRVLANRPVKVSGTLEQVECVEDVIRLYVRTDDRLLTLLLDDPQNAPVKCGPQDPRQVAIEYDLSSDEELGTIGVVRSLEFAQ